MPAKKIINSLGAPAQIPHADPEPDITGHVASLSNLLDQVDGAMESSACPTETKSEDVEQYRLVQVRLGIASSLFMALRAKHAPTASHCLRVALGCSNWGTLIKLSDQERDEIEVAALLHDIGKIGVPDQVLLKPGKLTLEESITMDRHRLIGEQILLSCCASQNVLAIVKYGSAWYNGGKAGFDRDGEQLPLGARMVAIIQAYDAMTTDQVYRTAMSRERAIAELFQGAGSQFDPQLVEQFCDFLVTDRIKLTTEMARRWLHDLKPEISNMFWKQATDPVVAGPMRVDTLFHQKLLDNMHDGIVFVDTSLRIMLWNRGAERLTGLKGASVEDKQWSPELIGMCNEKCKPIGADACPVGHALATGIQTLRRLTITGRTGTPLCVDVQVMPVIGRNGLMHGATLLLHDASSQITLEQQVQLLHEKAIQDPLTKIANRAEFDRVLAQFVDTHLERGLPCALIICDIDHFKRVNDNFGHQAGDDVLRAFAALLQRSSRAGDLVARYGGEEFVMVCADCDNATATDRAESIRQKLEQILHASIGHKNITASFGVTEIQSGDSPDTMLHRADRALLQAKANGRNRVVQLGTGSGMSSCPIDLPDDRTEPVRKDRCAVRTTLVTMVPTALARAKLEGFASDHEAKILASDETTYHLRIQGNTRNCERRQSDRPLSFLVSLHFMEETWGAGRESLKPLRTRIHVVIRAASDRERRRPDKFDDAHRLLVSLKAYFMAYESESESDRFHIPKLVTQRSFWQRLTRWW